MGKITMVYVVIGGYDYEGEDSSSIAVFSTMEKAEQYVKDNKGEYGYFHIKERIIE